MKNKFYLFAFAATIALALVFANSCKEDEENVVPTDTPTLSVDKITIPAAQTAGTYSFAVTGNVDWTASASPNFVELSPTAGTGNVTVTVKVPENTSLDTRSSTITVNGGPDVEAKTITVTQLGLTPALLVEPSTMTFSALGDELPAVITANVAWMSTVTDDNGEVDWITVTPSEGTSSAITIATGANTGAERSATVTFSATNATGVTPQTIEVTQEGVMLEVGEQTIEIDAEGLTGDNITAMITVASNVDWTVTVTTLPEDNPALAPAAPSPHEWVAAGREDNSLIYAIDASPYPRERSATITVSGGGLSKDIIVTQGAREHMFVGGEIVGGVWEWDAPRIPETEPGSGIYVIDRGFTAGIFKLPLRAARPTAFFAAGTKDEVVAPNGTEHDLYLVPLTTDWTNDALDLKWKIESGNPYKLTVNLNTMKLKLEAGTPPTDDSGVLIGGVMWAKFNVDTPGMFTADPQDPGKYYQFLSRLGYSTTDEWPGANGPGGANTPKDAGWYDEPHTANDPCPAGWRVPRDGDFDNLRKTGYRWRNANSAGNSVAGAFFGTNANSATIGNPGTSIFIPAAGRRTPAAGTLEQNGSQGWVHTGNPYYGVSSQIVVFKNSGTTSSSDWGNTWLNRQERNDDNPTAVAAYNWGTGASVRCIKNQ
jgi:hypothetical protein